MKNSLFFFISLLLLATTLQSQIINVPGDYSSIQSAIDASVDGDTILVSSGTYFENNITFSGKEVVLLSENGPDATFIDGSNSGGIFDCMSGETFNTEINGFTIHNGQANIGSAIHIINTSYLTVRNCNIINNSSPGIWTRAAITIGQAYNNGPHTPAGIHMYDCLIEGNSGYYGGGVFNEESGAIASVYERCIFKNNTGQSGAAIHGTRNSIIQHCLFYNNTSSNGTSIVNNEGGSPQVTNCTFADNSGYAFCRNSNTLNTEIRNCIFYGNTGTWCEITNVATIVMEYCNDEDGNSGMGNINQNPLFVNSSAGDYTLQSSSPCIDSGHPDSGYNDPDGTVSDMGAFYFHQGPFVLLGCLDQLACNFTQDATEDDGSCDYLDECGVCGGLGIDDGDCDCDGNQLDVIGVCGGDCISDFNSNSICDINETFGCTYSSSVNYNSEATVDDGSCIDEECDLELAYDAGYTDGMESIICPEDVCPADLDENGYVSTSDLLIFLTEFGQYCDVLDACGVINGDGSTCADQCGELVSHDGYDYSTVQIGEQCWFSENCRYLPVVSPSSEGSETDPNYYVYDYQGTDVTAAKATTNYDTYGVLYNWPAVMTEGICPSGWHIPSDEEFTELTDLLGGESVAGNSMKSTSGWNGGGNGSNSSGFTGLPGGYRASGGFSNDGNLGYWWSASESGSFSWTRELYYSFDSVYRDYHYRFFGFSARCVRD